MIFAGLYARKSTKEEGKTEEEKSVTRQRDHALDYAKTKGWRILPECMWVEPKEISGGTLERPALNALRKALKPKPTFQKLIVMDKDRLSRDLSDGLTVLMELYKAGVEVWEYLHDKPVRLGTPTEKLVEAVQLFGGEQERFQIGLRTKDGLKRKREAGYATGPAPYGFKNIQVMANGQHQHSTREVVPEEARVIKKLFEAYASGRSPRKIAHQLNEAGLIAPKPRQKGRLRAWSRLTVRSFLNRASYREIVGDRLWERVEQRFKSNPTPRPPGPGTEGKYLLSGLCICGFCGGPLALVKISRTGSAYVCGTRHQRGKSACKNSLVMPLEIMEQAVLAAVEHDMLKPERVVAVINKMVANAMAVTEKAPDLKKELAKIEVEFAKYVAMVAKIGDDDTLAAEIKKRKARKAEIVADLEMEHKPARIDVAKIKREVKEELAQWKRTTTPEQKRRILGTLLTSRLVFTPREDNGRAFYEFEGSGSLSPILSGLTAAKVVKSGA